MSGDVVMVGVREYAEEYEVKLVVSDGYYKNGAYVGGGRLAVKAVNEGGHNSTLVDLLDLLAWVKANRPELLS